MSEARKTAGKYNIAVVDDEPEISELIGEELSDEFCVKTFHSPEVFVRAVREGTFEPAILVTDLKMPGLTGLEMLAKIKELNFRVPTVMFSGYLEKDDVIEAVELGVVHVLEKPVDIQKVRDAVVATLIDVQLMEKREALKSLVRQLSEMHTAYRLAVSNFLPEGYEKSGLLSPSGDGLKTESFDSIFDLLEEKIDELIREEEALSKTKNSQKLK